MAFDANATHQVLGSLLAGIAEDNAQQYEANSAHPAVQEAVSAIRHGDLQAFYFAMGYPLSNVLDGMLDRELPGQQDAQFLFKHAQFVERHFQAVLVEFEGRACSADKSGTVLRHLLAFQTTGKRIAFDYSQEYTFHLPKRVFCGHNEITGFFTGVRSLYQGQSAAYLDAIQGMRLRLGTPVAPSADPAGGPLPTRRTPA